MSASPREPTTIVYVSPRELRPTDDYPRGYVATRYPDAATLERLRAQETITK